MNTNSNRQGLTARRILGTLKIEHPAMTLQPRDIYNIEDSLMLSRAPPMAARSAAAGCSVLEEGVSTPPNLDSSLMISFGPLSSRDASVMWMRKIRALESWARPVFVHRGNVSRNLLIEINQCKYTYERLLL